jgi:hypothetical protein
MKNEAIMQQFIALNPNGSIGECSATYDWPVGN